MFSSSFIRRLADQIGQLARLVAFDVELEVELDEAEVLEALGYRCHARG